MPGLHSVPPRSVPPNNVPLPASFLRTPIAHRALHDRKAGRPETSPAAFRAAIEDPREAFLAYVRMLVPHMTETDFRGCGFSNVAVEITDARSPILSVIQDHDAMYLEHVEKTTRRLIASDPRRFRRMDAAATARTYYLLVEGALVASRNLRSLWPLEHAIHEVESWLR